MKTAVIFLSVLVGILYLKWILIILVYPWQAFHYQYRKSKKTFWKVLGAPYALWEKIVAVSVADMKRNYEKLDVSFDLWNGESSVHGIIPGMVEEMKKAVTKIGRAHV